MAHNSAGPKLDIVTEYNGQPTGYLADSVETFADAMNAVLSLSDDDYETMAFNARASASDKFSEVTFGRDMMRSLRKSLVH